MVDKPRIAFCFSGQARTLEQTYLFFQKNLFDAAKEQGFDYDIFCAVEDDEDVDKVKLLNPTIVERIKSNDVEKIIENKYGRNWESNIFEDCVMYFSVSKKREVVIHNFMQQLYKVSSSFLMAKKSGHNYDILIKLRFDCVFLNKINFINIKTIVSNGIILCNKGASLFSRKKIQGKLVLINDMFFFGNERSMYMLCDIFYNIKISLKGGKPNILLSKIFYGIKYLSFHLNKLLYCNKEIKRCIFPIISINYLESFFYRVYSPEICYYYYFINLGIKVVLDNFSRLLLRDTNVENYINFVNKNNYEI